MKPAQLLSQLTSLIEMAPPGTRLPSDAGFALELGVSRGAVSRAMASLADKGLVSRIHGSGTYVPGGSEDLRRPAVLPRTTAAERLAGHLQDEIAGGRFRLHEPLPPVKLICHNFRVAPGTAIAALRMLRERALVTRAGKSYRVAPFAVSRSTNSATATFYIYGDKPAASLYSGWQLGMAFEKMEHELLRMGLRIIYEPFRRLQMLCETQRTERLPRLSVVSFLPGGAFRECAAMIGEHVGRMRVGARPSVLLIGDIPDGHRAPRLMSSYARGNTATVWARTLARFLFAKRLRRVVLFVNTVRPTYRTLVPHLKILFEHAALDRDARHRVVFLTAPGATVMPARDETKIAKLALDKYGSRAENPVGSFSVPVTDMVMALGRSSEADAWLFSRDEDAAAALDFCSCQGVRIPRDLSIVGLSNEREFLDLGITTCIEDWDTIGYQMAHSVLGDLPIAKTSRGFIRSAALMVERSTTPLA